MAHIVTCPFCGTKFDRDKIPFIQVSAKRYAHVECYNTREENKTQEQKDLEELEDLIKTLFKEPYVNARIKKQIKDYVAEYHYTYRGIILTLNYWYVIKAQSIEKANGGIGIVPFIYEDARRYYRSIYMAKMANIEKDSTAFIRQVKEISIESPRVAEKPIKLFNLEDEDE